MGEHGDFALPFCCEKKRNAVNSTFLLLFTNAADRNRTGTGITTHGILSPGRLPVPPLRHVILIIFQIKNGTYRARTCDPLLVRQMLSQLS